MRSSKATSRGEELILQIKSLHAPLVFSDDDEKTRPANMHNLALINILVLIPVLIVSKILCVLDQVIDLTERKRAEEKPKDSEDLYKLLFENANEGIVLNFVTPEGLPSDIIQADEVICKMQGYTKEEMIRLKLMDIQVEG